MPLVPPLPPLLFPLPLPLLTLFDELELLEFEELAAAAAAATAAAAAAAEAAAEAATLEVVELSKGDKGGWLPAAEGEEGVFGWGVPSVSEEVRRSCGDPPGGRPVASYLLAQLFMGLWLEFCLC